MRDDNLTRRTFLQTLAAAVPAGAILLNSEAQAEDLVKIDPESAQAKALVYVHNAADVDTSNPLAASYQAGRNCANCVLIQGEEGAEWRPCGIFPGQLVANAGWCSAWQPKP